jgi:hypothetical protein
MPRFTPQSKQEKRDKRDRRRARSTLPRAPPTRPPCRGVTLTLRTRSGRKVLPSAKAIEGKGTSAQTHTQPAQTTQAVTDRVSDLEFHSCEWENILYYQQDLEDHADKGILFENLMNMT